MLISTEWVIMEFNVAAGIFHPFATMIISSDVIILITTGLGAKWVLIGASVPKVWAVEGP